MPDKTESDRVQAEHVIERLRSVSATAPYESWLGAAKELLNQEDRDLLLASALRGFFIWEHRERRRQAGHEVEDRPAQERKEQGDGQNKRRRRRRPRRD